MINTACKYGYKLCAKECLNGAPLFKVHTYTHAMQMKKQLTDCMHQPIWIIPIRKNEFMNGIWREPSFLGTKQINIWR